MMSFKKILFLFSWLTLLPCAQQFPQSSLEKRFNVVAEPAKNGTILLRVKGHYGLKGPVGMMGDQGQTGLPGTPGLMGPQGNQGFCSAETCNSMRQLQLLMSRVEKLEMMMKSLDEPSKSTSSVNPPVMALHITSDILFSKGNVSKPGDSGLPRNINLNIALKNNAKVDGKSNAGVLSNRKNGKFSVNSTIFLDPATGSELKSGIATPRPTDEEAMTERQFQATETGFEQRDVPSIKKNKIPRVEKP